MDEPYHTKTPLDLEEPMKPKLKNLVVIKIGSKVGATTYVENGAELGSWISLKFK